MPDTQPERRNLTLAFVGFTSLWLLVFNQLRFYWTNDPQYSFGWCIPVMAAYFFWQRWLSRPSPTTQGLALGWKVLAGLLIICLLPLRVVIENNIDWRLLPWLLTMVAAALSALAIAQAGGKKWLRHFLFPILFLFLIVPWFSRWENLLVQGLMKWVALGTVELLTWSGIPALAQGQIIHLAHGPLGVDRACSGIQSLQATLMASLFLGEMYGMRPRRRFLLLGAGLISAFLCNLARAFVLAYLASARGIDYMSQWHDQAGFAVLAVASLLLWALCWLLQRRTLPVATGANKTTPTPPPPRLLPAPLWAGLILFLAFSELFTQLWFHSGATKVEDYATWEVRWPTGKPTFKSVDIGSGIKETLHYQEGSAGNWVEEDGSRWTTFFFRWAPAENVVNLTRYHRPEMCMSAVGMELKQDLGVKLVAAGGLNLPMRGYHFINQNNNLFIFYFLWRGPNHVTLTQRELEKKFDPSTRIRASLARQSRVGQQILEIGISGMTSAEEAEKALLQRLEGLLKPAGSRGNS